MATVVVAGGATGAMNAKKSVDKKHQGTRRRDAGRMQGHTRTRGVVGELKARQAGGRQKNRKKTQRRVVRASAHDKGHAGARMECGACAGRGNEAWVHRELEGSGGAGGA
jgi:hypothetical protein